MQIDKEQLQRHAKWQNDQCNLVFISSHLFQMEGGGGSCFYQRVYPYKCLCPEAHWSHNPFMVQGLYAVCHLRQCSTWSVVCISWSKWGDSSEVRSVYVYVLEAAKLPCVLIAVFWLPCYYYVVNVCRVLYVNHKPGGQQVSFEVRLQEGLMLSQAKKKKRKKD